ncbi:restriction endonuclease subunit S [Rubinisphaera brasiliensis]|uniref:Restriction modification system DNA specificity domain protein n=1 Tax=Rubinisphaera brasiliensis (strain ATCC 49424 / DSM 5305 / JCM 21570 / IAM 15109 / NBRC 103401 / IFAM 1448) TaxID=756272 RepID=F0SQN9_RUBBR|nr:restriction endonuclease subunit S [Rubinisphaera brasiliensis]ADY59069.1 restriction modification system DNA specificity domain protein [Rubinisphaera brasiliensis DSM 5305]
MKRLEKWRCVSMKELYHGLYDGPHATPKPSDSGPVFLGIKNITDDGHLDLGSIRHISESDYAKWTRRVEPQENDIVFTYEATLNRYAIIPKGFRGCLGRRLALIRPNTEMVDPKFLFLYFFGHTWRDLIATKTIIGSTVNRIPLLEFPDFEITLPPLPTQRKIASILSAYDDLIENNTRRIAILEQMAQALYREWFVHFRFPGHENVKLVDSPLGQIPEGWEVEELQSLCKLVMGQSPKSEFYNEVGDGLPFHQGVTNFGDRYPTHKTFCTVKNRLAHENDILFSVRAPVGRINIANCEIVVGRGVSAIRRFDDAQIFLFHQLKELFSEEDIMGGGTIFKSVTKHDLTTLKLLSPSPKMVELFEQQVQPAFALYENLTKRNEVLRTTRDLLLPKLISGKLDVADLDIDMGELVEHMDKVATPTATPKLKKQPRKKGTPYKDDAAIICMLLDELEKQKRSRKEFVVQKHVFALKHHRNLKFNSEFKVMQAGPWSHDLRRKAIFAGEKQGWLWFKENTKTIEKGNKFDEALAYAEKNLSDQIAEVRRMVNELVAFTNNQLECWMTVFKVVIDLQAAETPITFSTIQHGIDNWKGKRKKRHFSVENVNKVITEMVRSDWIVLDK